MECRNSSHSFQIISTAQCATTMAMAREAIDLGWGHGTVCRSFAQTQGRGRIPGRLWLDDGAGALLFTLILERKQINIDYPLTQCLALALCLWLENYSIRPSIKWPNDVRIAGRKIAGILVETMGDYFLAGMGINLRNMRLPANLKIEATSLHECLNSQEYLNEQAMKKPDNQHLTDLLSRIEITLTPPPPISQIVSRLESRGRRVRVNTGSGDNSQSFEGILRGLKKDGALLVDIGKKESKTVYSGELVDI